MNVHCVLDRFSFECFAPDLSLTPLGQHAAPEPASADLLLLETAWNSVDGGWNLAYPGHQPLIAALMRRYREAGVPVALWNKEDPPHFGKFDLLNREADLVLTTDKGSFQAHRRVVGHDRVHVWMFAAQPVLHHDDPALPRIPRPCFAGTYHRSLYPHRARQMDVLLPPALRHGLRIFDRSKRAIVPRGDILFPDAYDAAIVGSLPYRALCNVYRQYRVFLNVHSVQHSATMFARRVLELLCSGTPVISGYSAAIERLFPGLVPVPRDAHETDALLRAFLTDDLLWEERSLAGQRAVLAAHTVPHRIAELCGALGVPVPPRVRARRSAYERAAELESRADVHQAVMDAIADASGTMPAFPAIPSFHAAKPA